MVRFNNSYLNLFSILIAADQGQFIKEARRDLFAQHAERVGEIGRPLGVGDPVDGSLQVRPAVVLVQVEVEPSRVRVRDHRDVRLAVRHVEVVEDLLEERLDELKVGVLDVGRGVEHEAHVGDVQTI